MPRDTEFVIATQLRVGDELPNRGKIEQILNDSTILTLRMSEGTTVTKSQHAPVERYMRRMYVTGQRREVSVADYKAEVMWPVLHRDNMNSSPDSVMAWVEYEDNADWIAQALSEYAAKEERHEAARKKLQES